MYYHSFLISRELGGAGMMALEVAAWMARQGHKAHVWIPGSGPASEAAAQRGLKYGLYDLEAMKRGHLQHAMSCLRMVPRLQFRRGWAHVHHPVVYQMLRPVLRQARLRTAVAVQIEPSTEELRWAFGRPPDVILPCARFLETSIRKALGEAGERLRIEPVPNAVDTQKYHPGRRAEAKEKVGADAKRPLALMMANLAPHKGQETALRAMAELKARSIQVDCWFAGTERDGRQEFSQRLRALTEELALGDRVRFLGFRTDGPDLLRAADFLLLPSTHEGLPLSLLEAQASKTLVLAAPTAGVPEIVSDGETGFLIPADNARAYADRMELLMTRPELGEYIGQKAYDLIQREYTMSAYCCRIHDLLWESDLSPGRRKPSLEPRSPEHLVH